MPPLPPHAIAAIKQWQVINGLRTDETRGLFFV
jgi:hypothetical protein